MLGLERGHGDVDVGFERLDVLRHVHLGAVDEEVQVYEVVGAAGAQGEEGVEVG